MTDSITQQDAEDAARYRWLRAKTGAGFNDAGSLSPSFHLPRIIPVRGTNLMKGSVAQHLDKAIDAAMAQSAPPAQGDDEGKWKPLSDRWGVLPPEAA